MGRRKANATLAQEEAPRCKRSTDDTLRYIAEMTAEMAALAGAGRLPMLTYFLNMARVEAEMQIHERDSTTIFDRFANLR